ncbi:MAG: NTP transferase domain-containing protein [Gemmatimonadetes bacterium]|nr:NTP transferase domain-containing protein [Gemmatimonadota bacterium]
MSEVTLVCMVAGLSRRFGGRIKGFARVGPNGERLVEFILEQALRAGISRIVFVVSEATRTPFQEVYGSRYRDVAVEYALQEFDPEVRRKPWGTVDAVCAARESVGGPFVVCNGDDICGEQAFGLLADHLARSGNAATVGFPLGKMLPEEGTVNRGVFELNEDGTLKSAAELFDLDRGNMASRGLTPDTICNVNLFGFHPPVLGLLGEVLASFKAEHAGDPAAECLLPTEIDGLVSSGKLVMDVFVSEEDWIGVTNPEDEEKVRELLARRG